METNGLTYQFVCFSLVLRTYYPIRINQVFHSSICILKPLYFSLTMSIYAQLTFYPHYLKLSRRLYAPNLCYMHLFSKLLCLMVYVVQLLFNLAELKCHPSSIQNLIELDGAALVLFT